MVILLWIQTYNNLRFEQNICKSQIVHHWTPSSSPVTNLNVILNSYTIKKKETKTTTIMMMMQQQQRQLLYSTHTFRLVA